MKVMVTGGAGFIGSHVVDGFRSVGLEVIVVDDLSRGSRDNLRADVRFYEADIRDRYELEAVFRREQADIICHHAAQIDVRKSVADPICDVERNIAGSLNLLELAIRFDARRFLFASSGGAVYGRAAELPAREDTPIRPLSPYGVSKHSAELYVRMYGDLYGLPYVILRYGNVFGPRQSPRGEAGVVAVFCEQLLRGVTPTIYGDGTKTRDYVEVSDVVQANLDALDRGEGQAFNIATGRPTSDFEIFSTVREALGIASAEPEYVPPRPGEVEHIYLDVRKAEEGLGWTPRLDLKSGILRTVNWFRAREAVSMATS